MGAFRQVAVEGTSVIDRFSWVDESALGEAACVTVVTGTAPEPVLQSFGAEGAPRRLAPHDALDEVDPMVAIARIPAGTVAVEYNGYEGSRQEVLAPASRDGLAASVFWNVNMDMQVHVAERGCMLLGFDPVIPDQVWGADPSRFAELMRELRFGDEQTDPIAAGLALVEAVTGVELTEELIDSAQETYTVGPVLEAPRPSDPWTLQHHQLRWDAPDLIDLIARLQPWQQRQLAAFAAREAAAMSGLDTNSEVAACLVEIDTAGYELPALLWNCSETSTSKTIG
jgi:hypothetical protein